MLILSPAPASRAQRRRGWLLLSGVILLHFIVLWGFGLYRPLSLSDPIPLTVLTATVVPEPVHSPAVPAKPLRLPDAKASLSPRPTPASPDSRPVPLPSVPAVPATSVAATVPANPAPAPLAAPQVSSAPGTADKGPPDKGAVASESALAGSTGGPANASAGKTIGNTGNIEQPSTQAAYLQNPRPEYPRISRQRGEQGRVLLRVLIGVDGQAQQTEISKSSGFSRLDQAALGAVAGWRFVPGKRNGVPEAMWFTVPIGFCLDADGVQCQP